MQYFKHSELANMYHVSIKTVHNWIDASKQGKITLNLYRSKSRTYIANTPENLTTLKRLSENGKKYRNSRHRKIIQPKPEFYEIYSRRQILDIVTNLSVHREIPYQYNYVADGANNWDDWLKRLAREDGPSTLKGTIELLQASLPAIDKLLEGKKHVNVIDLGAGNAYPVKNLLGHLIDKKILHRYIAIDISASMLDIAKANIKDWYGNDAPFEGYVRDISSERFDDILVEEMLSTEADQTVNLVLLLGATPVNFRAFDTLFRVAYGSIGSNDILIYTSKPDTEASRRYFDFNSNSTYVKLPPLHQYILDLMNIDESLYDAEMGYDDIQKMRYIRVRFTSAVSIELEHDDIRRTIDIEKGEAILLLRMKHLTTLEIISELEKIGFTLLHSNLTQDRQFFMSVNGVNPEANEVKQP